MDKTAIDALVRIAVALEKIADRTVPVIYADGVEISEEMAKELTKRNAILIKKERTNND